MGLSPDTGGTVANVEYVTEWSLLLILGSDAR